MNGSQSTFSDADWPRVARYLAGELEGRERAEIEAWIAAAPERSNAIKSLLGEWDNVPQRSLEGWDVEGGRNKVLSRVRVVARSSKKTHSYKWIGYGLAAAVVALLINIGITAKEAKDSRTYSTATGQRAKITLSSGVQIVLAPASKLIVTDNSAQLEGQAVFTVLHKSNAPFTVKSGSAEVRVLGTTFGVRHYAGEKAVQVIVAEGKVSANNVVLSGGDAATVNSGGVTVHGEVDVAAVLSWTSGRLTFNETPLKDVIQDLNRWYNVDIRLGVSSLGTLPVTGSFPEGDVSSLPNILEVMLDARTATSGRVITIYPK